MTTAPEHQDRTADEAEAQGEPRYRVSGKLGDGRCFSRSYFTFNGPDSAEVQALAEYPDLEVERVERAAAVPRGPLAQECHAAEMRAHLDAKGGES